MNSSTHTEDGIRPAPTRNRWAGLKDFVTLACIMSLAFVAAPCLLFASMTWKVDWSRALVSLSIAGGILTVAAAWFYLLYQLRPAAENEIGGERTAFIEGQQLTRGELFAARICLAVTAIFLWAIFDVVFNGVNGIGGVVSIPTMIAPFLIFGFVSIVATHGKWKLTLAALGCFVSSVVLGWTTFALLWD